MQKITNRRRKLGKSKGVSPSQAAKAAGFRSAGEMMLFKYLQKKDIPFRYEDLDLRIPYVVPASEHMYNCDFALKKKDGTIMYVEYKGRWEYKDMEKHRLVQEQHPTLDIRIIFERDPNKQYVRKGSKTTYADVCTGGRGFGKWKNVSIPYTKAIIKNGECVLPKSWVDELAKE